jgi:tRNA U34 5-carboxymethylaminomethyl modifying GTPase MnmE/TrmE
MPPLSRILGIEHIWKRHWGSWTRSWTRVVRSQVHLSYRAQLRSATAPEDIVLGAEELRYAAQAVGKVSGLVDVEDVLDVIFTQFCIGK